MIFNLVSEHCRFDKTITVLQDSNKLKWMEDKKKKL